MFTRVAFSTSQTRGSFLSLMEKRKGDVVIRAGPVKSILGGALVDLLLNLSTGAQSHHLGHMHSSSSDSIDQFQSRASHDAIIG